MRSYSPVHVKHLLAHRFLGDASFADVCDEHIIVNEAEPFDLSPSIFLPHHLDNVVSLGPETTKTQENKRLYGGDGIHTPVEAFRISNVKYRDSGLYKRNWRFYFPQVQPPQQPNKVEHGSYALASSYSGVQYFGHWLRDDMTTRLLAEQFAKPMCARIPDWPHPAQYLDMLKMEWPVIDYGNFEELYFFLDFSQNSNKAARYRTMRKRVRQHITPKHKGHRVYLRRGETGAIKRIISNEAELMAALEREGFHIVDIVNDPLQTIVETLLEARLLVTIEGSQADHAIYTLADRAGFLAIMPPNMLNNVPKDWTNALGMEYGLVIGETDGDAFKLNIRDMLATVEMLEAAL